MIELLGLSENELRAQAEAWSLPAYRGSQLYHAIYRERCWDIAAMTNLSEALREELSRQAAITLPRIVSRFESSDGAVRYVLELPGSAGKGSPPGPEEVRSLSSYGDTHPARQLATIETVWMPEDDRQTLCLSSQAGCAVDCRFCATAQLGLIRNLTAGEIAGQVLALLNAHHGGLRPRTNIVLMGQGEPLHNYDAALKAVSLMSDPGGMAIPLRRITLSTVGIVPAIRRLAQEEVRPKLAVSLNATTDEQRDQIIPVNRKWNLACLLGALENYPLRTWERITFEYVLLGGFNEAAADARRLVKLLSRLKCKVNLIPWNTVPSLPYCAPVGEAVETFQRILRDAGLLAFIRRSRGQDVFAACGQLSLLDVSQKPPID